MINYKGVFYFLSSIIFIAYSCPRLPSNTWVGARRFTLMQSMECKGTKITEIPNILDADQCRDACQQYNCVAVNIFQISEFNFMCEILEEIFSYEPAQGASCYMVDIPLSE